MSKQYRHVELSDKQITLDAKIEFKSTDKKLIAQLVTGLDTVLANYNAEFTINIDDILDLEKLNGKTEVTTFNSDEIPSFSRTLIKN